MDAVTYPTTEVQQALDESFVAYRTRIEDPLAKRFSAGWTPALYILDGDEIVRYRAFGYHPPAEFVHLLRVGKGTLEFERGEFKDALASFSRAADDGRGSALQPEALYWQGVCRYKTGDKEGLGRSWTRLLDLFPWSLWARKASFIRPQAGAAA